MEIKDLNNVMKKQTFKKFTSVNDVPDVDLLVKQALYLKKHAFDYKRLGENKKLVLLFFNPSLRTRLSTQNAGINLGMSVMSMNAVQGWQLEFEDQVVMNTDKAEHIREAAQVISQYADIIGLRSFPSLTNREKDYSDFILNRFIEFATVPVISLESAIRHPLQSLADLMTIEEHKTNTKPKVVLSWAPHTKALPQAVANSFLEWIQKTNAEVMITHPKGYELSNDFKNDLPIEYNQHKALENADFVYVKNWSSYRKYGSILEQNEDWMITKEKMDLTNNGKLMHCLPVRRNVVVADEVLDNKNALPIHQANNRTYAAQAVLWNLLKTHS